MGENRVVISTREYRALVRKELQLDVMLETLSNHATLTSDKQRLYFDVYELDKAMRYIFPSFYDLTLLDLRSKENLENE